MDYLRWLWQVSSPQTEQSTDSALQARSAIVVGAGIVGVSTAYYLQQLGYSVTIYDKAHEMEILGKCAEGSSTLCPISIPPWGVLTHRALPVALGGLIYDSIFGGRHVATRLTMNAMSNSKLLWQWGTAYSACQLDPVRLAAQTSEGALLGRYSIQCYEDLIKEKPEFATCSFAKGCLYLYEGVDEVSTVYNRLAAARTAGLEVDAIGNASKLAAIEPFLGRIKIYGDRYMGGLYSRNTMTGNSRGLTAAFNRHFRESAGVNIVYGTDIRGVATDRDMSIKGLVTASGDTHSADVYVLTSARVARRAAADLNVNMPLLSFQSYSIAFPWKGPKGISLYTSIADAARGICITPSGNREIIVSGFADVLGEDGEGASSARLADRCCALLEGATNYFDDALYVPGSVNADEGVIFGSSKFSATPDELPFVGQLKGSLFVNVGHGHRSLTLSCGTGKFLADEISMHDQGLKADARFNTHNKSLAVDPCRTPQQLCTIDAVSPVRFQNITATS